MSDKTTASATAASIDDSHPVPGFDDDLVDPKLLKKHLKKLPQAALLQGLRSAQLAVRANSVIALGLHGDLDEGICQSMAVLLRDESAAVRAATARALQGAAQPEFVLERLMAASADTDAPVRTDVASTIAAMGDAAIPLLIKALRMDPERADIEVVPHLVAFGSKAEKPTVLALDHTDERVRANAVAVLIQFGSPTLIRHQDRIRAGIQDGSAVVRKLTTKALAAVYRREHPSILEPHVPPVPGFGGAMITDAQVKELAGSVDEEVLLHFCRDGRETARRNAWRVFAARGKPGPYVTALAAVASRDDSGHVRVSAAEVLGAGHVEHIARTVAALVQLTGDSDDAVVAAANQAIDRLGTKALDQLIVDLDVRDGDRALLHIAAIVRFGQAAGAHLATATSHISPVARTLAREAVVQIGGKALISAASALVEGLHDPWDAARAASARAMGGLFPAHVKDPEAVEERLLFLYTEDGYLSVRMAAEHALRTIAENARR